MPYYKSPSLRFLDTIPMPFDYFVFSLIDNQVIEIFDGIEM